MKLPSWYRPESDRFIHLDVLRFIASSAVIVFHYKGLIDWSSALKSVPDHMSALRMAVDLFFVISGVVMYDLYAGKLGNWRAFGVFMRRRLARLAPLHYATFAFFALMGVAATRLGAPIGHPEAFDPACIIPNLTFIHSFNLCKGLTYNQPSWSISAEMGMYLLLPLFLWAVQWRRAAWAFLILFLTALFAGQAMGFERWTVWTYDFGVVRAVPSFLLGLLLAGSRRQLDRIPTPSMLMGLAFVAFAFEMVFSASDLVCVLTLYAIAALGVAADHKRNASRAMRLIAPLGRLTYSIYMLHGPIAIVVVTIVGKRLLHLEGIALNALVVLLAVVILPTAALVSYVFFETPLRLWLSGRTPLKVGDVATVQHQI
ncbi:MAG: acyltransferase [Caulobacteraceae bacterium]